MSAERRLEFVEIAPVDGARRLPTGGIDRGLEGRKAGCEIRVARVRRPVTRCPVQMGERLNGGPRVIASECHQSNAKAIRRNLKGATFVRSEVPRGAVPESCVPEFMGEDKCELSLVRKMKDKAPREQHGTVPRGYRDRLKCLEEDDRGGRASSEPLRVTLRKAGNESGKI